MRSGILIVLCGIALSCPVLAQQFYRSSGLQLFNQKQYGPAADSILAWAQEHASERGIAFYYAGESQYNSSFATKDPSIARIRFGQAVRSFQDALGQTDLSTLHAERKPENVYKLAWAHFRLSESETNTTDPLRSAVQYFNETARIGNDSLQILSKFMAGESELRRAQALCWQADLSENAGTQTNLYQEAVLCANRSITALESLKSMPLSAATEIPIRMRERDAFFELARLYQNMPNAVFTQIGDVRKGKSSESTAEALYRREASYAGIFSTAPSESQGTFSSAIKISEAWRRLYLFMLTRSDADKQFLNGILDSLGRAVYPMDKAMIQGFANLCSELKSDAFLRLADPQTSPFYQASQGLAEAWFWLGMAQYLSNDPKSMDSLERFLKETTGSSKIRIRYLRDHASYLSMLIRFDRNSGNRDVLVRLKRELDGFKPIDGRLKNRADLLQKLVRLSLGEPVWGTILNASTTEERFRDAFVMVQDALMRATQVTGKNRAPYLQLLDALFEITQYKKPEETAFYRGMALFLRAEIQESAERKRDLYRAAAEALKPVNGIYTNEAKYIQARSIFAGAKHGSSSLEDYNQAKPLFVELIQSAQSLRSLFYLGEILRVQENDLAARLCYQIVLEKTNDQTDGRFWYQNAVAALGLCRSRGDASVLQGIQISRVQFPEVLLTNEDGEAISLERFADYDYLRRQVHDQAVELSVRFGLPKPDLYPSLNRIEGSQYAIRDFYPITAGIQDRLETLISGLRLLAIVPDGISRTAVVTFNRIPLMQDSRGFFIRSGIPLGETADIRIVQNGFYPYSENHLFTQPGLEQMTVSLASQIRYIPKPVAEKERLIQFSTRSDRNAILMPNSLYSIPPASLLSDFDRDVRFRDFAYSESHGGFLAVHAKKLNPILYRNGVRSEWTLSYPKGQTAIQSAEGIAVDSGGDIYIVDWKGHTIYVFNFNGCFIRTIGSFGRNTAGSDGKPVGLEFPMRIAVTNDASGILIDSLRTFRSPVLFVTDQNGIQCINHQGIFLNTITPEPYAKGSLLSISADGYDRNVRITTYNQQLQTLIRLEAEPYIKPR